MAGTKHSATTIADLTGDGLKNRTVTLKGMVHSLRDMGGVSFLTLRLRDGTAQCVCGGELDLADVCDECAVAVTGAVRPSPPPKTKMFLETPTYFTAPSCVQLM